MSTGLTLEENMGLGLPTTLASKQLMEPDIPKVKAVLKANGAEDLTEMIFGEEEVA